MRRFKETARIIKIKTEDNNNRIASCCKELMEAATMAEQQLTKFRCTTLPYSSTKLKVRKQKVLSQINKTITDIKYLEDHLTVDVDRLRSAKHAKKIFNKHLEMERIGTSAIILGEIRSSIVPAPRTVNGSDFTYSLLDDSAEIVVTKIATLCGDDQDSKLMELGCFFKGGGAAMKLLQGILLGSIDMQVEETAGPFPLRESLSSMIFQHESRYQSFLQMTHLFSRIDALVRSVRNLETKSFCTVKGTGNGDATLSVSMHHEGTVVQIRFWFCNLTSKDWRVTIVPNDVKVFIISTQRGFRERGYQLQDQAQSILAESHSDPILLRRICATVMEVFVNHVRKNV